VTFKEAGVQTDPNTLERSPHVTRVALILDLDLTPQLPRQGLAQKFPMMSEAPLYILFTPLGLQIPTCKGKAGRMLRFLLVAYGPLYLA
jgi:hypothetical protein